MERIGVWLVDAPNGGATVHSSSWSSFFVDVKNKKDLDPVLMELEGMKRDISMLVE